MLFFPQVGVQARQEGAPQQGIHQLVGLPILVVASRYEVGGQDHRLDGTRFVHEVELGFGCRRDGWGLFHRLLPFIPWCKCFFQFGFQFGFTDVSSHHQEGVVGFQPGLVKGLQVGAFNALYTFFGTQA